MRLRQFALPLLAVVVIGSGCKKNEPVFVPDPVPPAAPGPVVPPPAPPPAPPAVDPNIAIERARTDLVNTLGQQVYFEFDRADIRPQDQAVLDAKAAILSRHSQVRIRISGHADERGSDEYNMVLGNKRALAAKAYLERQGIAGSRIDVASYGEERPADPGSNEDAWALNRRGEFEVVAGREQLGTVR
jgi:peptidoglycan-associated lipoprotein